MVKKRSSSKFLSDAADIISFSQEIGRELRKVRESNVAIRSEVIKVGEEFISHPYYRMQIQTDFEWFESLVSKTLDEFSEKLSEDCYPLKSILLELQEFLGRLLPPTKEIGPNLTSYIAEGFLEAARMGYDRLRPFNLRYSRRPMLPDAKCPKCDGLKTERYLLTECEDCLLGRGTLRGLIYDFDNNSKLLEKDEHWSSLRNLSCEVFDLLSFEKQTFDEILTWLQEEIGMSCEEALYISNGDLSVLLKEAASFVGGAVPELSQRQLNILEAMLMKGATSSNKRLTSVEIAVETEWIEVDAVRFKDSLSPMVRMGLLRSKKGRGGGYWLSPFGQKMAEKIAKN